MVERLVANEKVEGSTPFARSKNSFMSELLKKKCVPCEEGVLPFDISEIHKYQKKVDGWEINKEKKKIFFLKCIRAGLPEDIVYHHNRQTLFPRRSQE